MKSEPFDSVTSPLIWDDSARIWMLPPRDGSGTFEYSDGDAIERALLESVQSCTDRSCTSQELDRHIRDWPSEYHLSAVRTNLLRGFSFPPGTTVLEIGAGCGAITRYLGEAGCRVLALEGSARRAEIAARRCEDLENVRMLAGNFWDFEVETLFDVVTVIGVLEYSAVYSDDPDPFTALLTKARSLLRPGGQLLVAIENQLGLKYWSGHFEDHHNRPYIGIQDLYPGRSARTFGRSELIALLERAGFGSHEVFYPFPDYKLTRVVISDSGARDSEFLAAQLLHRCASRTYSGSPALIFDEAIVWPLLERNHLLPELANSFLVMSTNPSADSLQPPLASPEWLAVYFSNAALGHRATVTAFERRGDSIEVRKVLRSPVVPPKAEADTPTETSETHLVRHVLDTAPYIKGVQYDNLLRQQLAGGGGIPEVAEWAAPWVHFLRDHALRDQSAHSLSAAEEFTALTALPADFLDCTPFNLIRTADGTLRFIDREWLLAEGNVELRWVFLRGIVYTLITCRRAPALVGKRYRELVGDVASRIGLTITSSDWEEALKQERSFLNEVLGRDEEPALTHLVDMEMSGDIVYPYDDHSNYLSLLRDQQASVHRLSAESVALREVHAIERQQVAHLSRTLTSVEEDLDSLLKRNTVLEKELSHARCRAEQAEEKVAGLLRTIEESTRMEAGLGFSRALTGTAEHHSFESDTREFGKSELTSSGDPASRGSISPLLAERSLREQFERENVVLRERHRNLVSQLRAYQEALQRVQSETELTEISLASYKDRLTERRSAQDALHQENSALKEELAALRARHLHLEQVFRSVIHSRSWRVTQPLRALQRALLPKRLPAADPSRL